MQYYPYDAWLHWELLSSCNLDCKYCFYYEAKNPQINKINIPSLLKTLEDTGRIFRISFTGGEPFLVPNIIEASVEITKKHYISFNTNLICENIKEFAKKINPAKVIEIHASLHIKELERANLLENFINNFYLCKKRGFTIYAQAAAYPPLLNEVEKYREFFRDRGIEISFGPFLGTYNGRSYPYSYSSEELKGFNLNLKTIAQCNQYLRVCNAGYNVGIIHANGDIHPCYRIKKTIGNIYRKIEFEDNLLICPNKICGCNLKAIAPHLFERALIENKAMLKRINLALRYFGALCTIDFNKFNNKIKNISSVYKLAKKGEIRYKN